MIQYLLTILIVTQLSLTTAAQSNWVISSTGVGDIKLGLKMSDIRAQLGDSCIIKDNDKGGFDIYDETEKLISIWSKRADGNIGFILIVSSQFQTSDGLRVGLTIPEVTIIRNDFSLTLDDMTYEEYFAPNELQTPDDNFYKYLNLLYFKSNNNKRLGDNYEFDESTQSNRSTSFNSDGYLEYFIIYQYQ